MKIPQTAQYDLTDINFSPLGFRCRSEGVSSFCPAFRKPYSSLRCPYLLDLRTERGEKLPGFSQEGARISLWRFEEAKKQLDTLEKQLGDPSLADAKKQALYAERQVKRQEAEAFQREGEEFVQRKQRALSEQVQLRTKDILGKVRAKVQKHAETEGYDYVLDKSGASTTQVPVLLYTKDATDITDALLKTINEAAPAAEEKK